MQMPKEEHTTVGSRPKRRRGTSFLWMSSKQCLKIKADGRIKEKKPLVTAPGSDRRGGKFDVPIFS